MKLTHPEDLFLLDKLFQLKSIHNNHILDKKSEVLNDKVIVVFGGSYGIGHEIVKLAQEMNAKIYSFSRSENGVDVGNSEQVKTILEKVYTETQRIDYVVCTAGILVKESIHSMSYADIIGSINTNYLGAINIAKESFPYLKKTKGSLLLYTSSSYTRGRMMYSIYSSTKAAIVNLVQALNEEWFEFGVRINCINPERTDTPMRVKNFGLEPKDSLLRAKDVAIASINTLISSLTGEVIDVRKK